MTFGNFSSQKDPKTLLKAFISTFTSEDFLVDIIRITLHPSDFGNFVSDKSNSVIDYIRDFLKGLNDISKKLQLPNSKVIQNQIQVVSTLLTIRESSAILLTYDNVFQHLVSKDLVTTKLVQRAVDNRIESSDEFRKQTDTIVNIIHSYYEVISVSSTVTLLDNLQDSIYENNLSPFEALKNYKDLIITAYNDLSKLQSLSKAESISDYFVISDESSCTTLAQTLVEYISRGFSVFKTGYDLLDKTLEGVESSSVHLIAAPSNHGKSIFTINLCCRMIQNNISDFEKNDAILFVTLEDDIYKLSRRFAAVFGNYRFDMLKKLFTKSYEMTRATQLMGMQQDSGSKLVSSLEGIFRNVLKSSIAKITTGNVTLILKHCNESTFSPGDLGRFIDRLRVEGYRIKACFIDYINCMIPTTTRFSNSKEYDDLGQIVQELRALSRIQHVPIISPCQNRRDSENIIKSMTNADIGDSYKLIRYADFIYMSRMRPDKNFLSEEVRPHVIPKKHDSDSGVIDMNTIKIKDQLIDILIPFEVKITKSKDSEKDQTKFMLFCTQNLRIYNNIDEYLKDAPIIKINSDNLEKDITTLTNLAITSISSDFMEHSNVIELNKSSFGIESEGDIIFN